jgi:hypothetical protein
MDFHVVEGKEEADGLMDQQASGRDMKGVCYLCKPAALHGKACTSRSTPQGHLVEVLMNGSVYQICGKDFQSRLAAGDFIAEGMERRSRRMPEDEKWEGLCYARKLERMEKQKKRRRDMVCVVRLPPYGNIGGESGGRSTEQMQSYDSSACDDGTVREKNGAGWQS